MPSRRFVGAALLSALVLGLGTTGPVEAAGSGARSGDHQDATPGSQPLPGYTIANPPLAPMTVRGKPSRVLQGVRQHAAYDIEVPARWNGELVMWAHGYRGTGTVLTVDPPSFGLRELLLQQGYAWAASSYARNDYDVATGVVTTRGLAQYAARRLGREPRRTYLAGVSMGGHVIGRSLEQYPGFYSGALPMCGVMGDQELFDYFLSYNLVAQDLADRPVYPPTPDYLTSDVPVIEQSLGLIGLVPGGPDTTNAAGKQFRAIATELTGGPRPGADASFAYWKDFPFTLFTPDNSGSLAQNAGRLAQNVNTRYRPNFPVDVNAGVQRVPVSDAYSRHTARLTQIPKIQGRPGVPVLTLHGLGDYFVPFSMEQIYARDVRRNHQSRFLVQRAVREVAHCEYTPNEVREAWNDLTTWVRSSSSRRGHHHVRRPKGDRVLNRSVVASPTFGCRFTDPTGATNAATPTHGLYPPCPRRGR